VDHEKPPELMKLISGIYMCH